MASRGIVQILLSIFIIKANQIVIQELRTTDFKPQHFPDSGPLQRLAFIHPTSRCLWKQHPDVLLLDCTYKTNRFGMALLNICAITGGNKAVQIGLVFVRQERQEDYEWALDYFRNIIVEEGIPEPLSIVTDRELGLIRALQSRFPTSRHLLCKWHVNMNVLAKTKGFFPSPRRGASGSIERSAEFQDFLSSWNMLLASPTVTRYEQRLQDMRTKYPARAMDYCTNTWLIWKEHIVAAWINQYPHFGITVTSPIEGSHATVKRYLQRGNSDLRGVFLKLQLFWTDQHANLQSASALQQGKPRHTTLIPIFGAVLEYIHTFALQKILQEQSRLPARGQAPSLPCTCSIQHAFGLPCQHKIWQIQQTGAVLQLEDIHPHWRIIRPDPGTIVRPSTTAIVPVLDPLPVQGRGRPRGALGGTTRSTRRDPSAFEIPSSSAPPALSRPPQEPLQGPIFIVNSGLRRLDQGHQDLYEPGTQLERAYMRGIGSVYQGEVSEDAATAAARAIEGGIVEEIELGDV